MATLPSGESVAAAIAARHTEVIDALELLEHRELMSGSRLPGWSRLTIACHLRYGAAATIRMMRDTLDGGPTAFYPGGRNLQRPATLKPDDGESAADVVGSLRQWSKRLDERLADVSGQQWDETVVEPPGNDDLGSISLWTLALLRLTEIEVHGYDLDLDLSPWGTTFVAAALPTRLQWLPVRRSNHRTTNHTIDGTWAFVSTEGLVFSVSARGDHVEVEEIHGDPDADVAIVGSGHQMLAFILGRASLDSLEIRGSSQLAESFRAAFPAP